MKFILRIFMCQLTLWLAPSVVAKGTVIDEAESTARFRNAETTTDAKVGKHAVVFEAPPGRRSFHALSLKDVPVDLGRHAGLAFWWKAKGTGLVSLDVKVWFPTLHEGRELVFPVWDQGDGPLQAGWIPAQVNFSEGVGARGDPGTLRLIEFRARTDADADVRLLIDHVVALPGTFRLRADNPRFDAGTWTAPLEFTCDGRERLTIDYGVGTVTKTLSLAPGQTVTTSLSLQIDDAILKALQPLKSLPVELWAQVRGDDVTRIRRTVRLINPLVLPPHPRLLVDAAQVRGIQARIGRHVWAGEIWTREEKRLETVLAKEVELPPRGGTNAHFYANPKTGAYLKAGKQIGPWQWEHVDRRTREVFRGDPAAHRTDYDGVKIGHVHAAWAKDAGRLALAFQITGDEKYAVKARAILLTYLEKYLDYPLTRHGRPEMHGIGRATANYLTESTWLIDMAQATDMIWDRLSDAERQALAERVFHPALRDSIRPVRCYVHNIQCWQNSAMGLVGLLFDDVALVHDAVHDRAQGYWRQIEGGILPGGVWYEGSWGYHFYTLAGLVPLTEAARHCGVDLYNEKLKAMYLAPTRFAMPDGRLPNFNDSGLMKIAKMAYRYELAAARWDEPAFRSMLTRSRRKTQEALLYGVDAVADKPGRTVKSANHEGAGYAILARGEGGGSTWLCLKYSPPSMYHGHADRLGFILYARGKIVAPDPGSVSYGLSMQREWYKATLSHSTLSVDQVAQEQKAGKCLGFGTRDGVDFAVLDDSDAIADVTFVRTAALLNQNLIVFIDQVRCDRERTLDFAYHQAGTWETLPPGTPWQAPGKGAYRYLREPSVRDASKGLVVSTRLADGWSVAVTVAGGEKTEAVTATGPGIGGAHVQVPCLILRRRAKETAVAWAIALDGRAPQLEWIDEGGRPRAEVATVKVSVPGEKPVTLRTEPGHPDRIFTVIR
ncbi:MAG: alginate lyase family protein [Lentisphaeria bacterium]|nr:alginate lyase family protein [Lentisphaeria bacterium]